MAPLDDVLSIDGNRHVFDRLRALIESRRAIAFSGAGASAGPYPLWPELVSLLIGEAVKRGLASEADRATWEPTPLSPANVVAFVGGRDRPAPLGVIGRGVQAPDAK